PRPQDLPRWGRAVRLPEPEQRPGHPSGLQLLADHARGELLLLSQARSIPVSRWNELFDLSLEAVTYHFRRVGVALDQRREHGFRLLERDVRRQGRDARVDHRIDHDRAI